MACVACKHAPPFAIGTEEIPVGKKQITLDVLPRGMEGLIGEIEGLEKKPRIRGKKTGFEKPRKREKLEV